MHINQVINMLVAARDQGAETVMIVLPSENGMHHAAYVDWISPAPVNNRAFLLPLVDEQEVLGNEEAESIDL